MRGPLLIIFATIGFAGMIWHSEYGESLWMIGFGLVGCALTFIVIPKDSP